jgi:predicted MFS family arabinose efflux permease
MNPISGFGAIRSALANRNYRIFTCGNLISHIGTWVQRVAVGWLTWRMTESGAWLGIVSFADLFPTVVLAPLTGAVADRVNRLSLMRFTQSLHLIQAATLAVLTHYGLMTIELLVLLMVISGSIVSFNQPVRLAIVPSLIDRRDLAAAIGINSLVFNGARFIGPAIAGYLIVDFGVETAFAFNSVTFLAFVAMLFMLRLPAPPGAARPPSSVRAMPREIYEGYQYAVRHPGIGPMLVILTLFSIFGRAYIELLPGFADQVFGRGASGLAWLMSMVGLGAATGGLWLAQRGTITGLTSIAVLAMLVSAVALLGFSVTNIFWLALPCVAIAGFGMIVLGVGEQTLIQNAVDPAKSGRVLGLYGMIGRGAPAIGALAMGGLSSLVGLQWPVAGGAVLCIGLWVWARGRQRTMAQAMEIEK